MFTFYRWANRNSSTYNGSATVIDVKEGGSSNKFEMRFTSSCPVLAKTCPRKSCKVSNKIVGQSDKSDKSDKFTGKK